ncbi:carbohydrate ABC transporter permease [Photobacterium gaetbulicola Gung47]|uniref:Carbohydrate ABC transporter permease n=1 Tax=Photobacterium gaetbulicola Gung47 TaxID=658445 RepID=A0A0C5WQM9_9GAMM|nr:carbohydrate ABC transporter permease [Photobacterium gaetbulicola]AJR09473.1 carbohydrate ABC transporter permease [Photobacterium gaetbulicola Gung47]
MNNRITFGSLIAHFLMIGLALSWLYPYVWMFMASLKPSSEVYTTSLFGGNLSLDNYAFLFDTSDRADRPFLRTMFNSLFVSLTITASVVITSMYIAFSLAKLKFKGQEAFRGFLIFQMVFPAFMFILPQYVLIKELGMIDTYGAMILPFVMSGWGIFMMSQSFKGTPNDYIFAAKLDRANLWQVITQIMMPLNKSIIAIVALFTFTGAWDNFLWPLIVMQDAEKMPLSVLLASFSKSYGVYIGPVMAGSVIQTMPLLMLFILFRKHFLQGMSLSLK